MRIRIRRRKKSGTGPVQRAALETRTLTLAKRTGTGADVDFLGSASSGASKCYCPDICPSLPLSCMVGKSPISTRAEKGPQRAAQSESCWGQWALFWGGCFRCACRRISHGALIPSETALLRWKTWQGDII